MPATPSARASRWPKQPPKLSPEQEEAREKFVLAWHEHLPARYSRIERFNHTALARLPEGKTRWRTLEIGAGIGGHLPFEDLSKQDYHCLEMRPEMCAELERLRGVTPICHDIQRRTTFADGTFDRVVAIHVLEHLRDLPAALAEIARILAADGILDVVLPCEGSPAYAAARRISAKPFFERRYGMSYDPIIANEHVSTLSEVVDELSRHFVVARARRFPFDVPIDAINLCVAFRMRKRAA